MKTFREEFASIKAQTPCDRIGKALDGIKSSLDGRPFVLYGAGRLGGLIQDWGRERGIEVFRFCESREDAQKNDAEIVGFDQLKNRFPNALVVPLTSLISSESEFQCLCLLLNFEARHIAGYEWAHGFFEDERSRQLVLDRMRCEILGEPLKPNTDCEEYYEEGFITLGDGEIFVDGGAFTGDSAEKFLSKTGNHGGCKVYSFEPDEENYKKAIRGLSARPNVTITQKGLWSSEQELLFSQKANDSAGSSFVNLSATENHRVPVTSLDVFFSGKPEEEWPTFIKMDIEGAEKEALLGAAEIIRRRKPKLAICAYHKPEDIYELPRTLLGIRGDYRLALRQHYQGWLDTVLYAA